MSGPPIKAAESIKKYCEKRKECHKCVFARLDEQWNVTRCRLHEELPCNWEFADMRGEE